MTIFEKILLGLLSAAPTTATVFVHSSQGLLVLNASENLLAGVLSEFSPKVKTA